jgi:hypothetical protein
VVKKLMIMKLVKNAVAKVANAAKMQTHPSKSSYT